MSVLKIEAFSGLSGDMFLGALAELTGAYDELVLLPAKLNLDKVEVKISDVEKAGIACKHIKILDHNEYAEHPHSHSHDKESAHSHEHKHTHNHDHSHDHSHAQTKAAHTHSHGQQRHLKEIEKLIDEGDLTDNAKLLAKAIFYILGLAESKVHGVDINKIHFHEVGAIDSILDIVGTAVLLDKLNIEQSVSSAICTGHGFVMADHGRMPIPAPATKELLLGMPTYAGKEQGEMTTPTGAAILKFLNPSFEIPLLIEKKTGHGPGEKNFEHPNVLRLTICESLAEKENQVYMVETNIDDMSAELLGNDFQENLLKAGAIDFYFTQIIMKKGRPGVLLSAFTTKKWISSVTHFLLENTTTIGVRSYQVEREILKRELKTVETSLGDVEVKEVELPSGNKRTTIEYESCKRIASEQNRPISEIYTLLNKEIMP